jgi:hypothetical protein
MKRTNGWNTKKLYDGREVYRPKIYPQIPLRDDDLYIVTELGDRFDTLAYDFYENSSFDWIIKQANNIHGAVFAIQPGTLLRVPQNWIEIQRNLIK